MSRRGLSPWRAQRVTSRAVRPSEPFAHELRGCSGRLSSVTHFKACTGRCVFDLSNDTRVVCRSQSIQGAVRKMPGGSSSQPLARGVPTPPPTVGPPRGAVAGPRVVPGKGKGAGGLFLRVPADAWG